MHHRVVTIVLLILTSTEMQKVLQNCYICAVECTNNTTALENNRFHKPQNLKSEKEIPFDYRYSNFSKPNNEFQNTRYGSEKLQLNQIQKPEELFSLTNSVQTTPNKPEILHTKTRTSRTAEGVSEPQSQQNLNSYRLLLMKQTQKPPSSTAKTSSSTAKAGGTSAVLTVNLSNFLLLFVFKVLVFILGYFGFQLGLGTGPAGRKRRELPELMWPLDDETEITWMMHFVRGLDEDLSCLRKLLCKNPDLKHQYSMGINLMAKCSSILPRYFNSTKYLKLLQNLQEAALVDSKNTICEKYSCSLPWK